MSKKNSNFSDEEFVIKYLKKNKKFFLQNPELLEMFNFNNITKHSNKIVDLKKELMDSRFALATSQIEDTSVFRKIKKEIAQANTVLTEKLSELNNEVTE